MVTIRYREYEKNKASGYFAEENGNRISPIFGDLESAQTFFPEAKVSDEASRGY